MNEDNVPVADEPVDPFEGRNPAVVHIMQFFTYAHLKGDDLQSVSAKVAQLAWDLARDIPDSPELTAGLRKLLEAKDCLVRAKLSGRS